MTREQIIEKWQNEIAQAESKLEASSLKYQMNLELEAYERGEEYNPKNDSGAYECEGCGS
jgi:predicted metal-binding protein